ncbi:MAG: isocitrate lyase/phosphoenolpyruvate mutase family protein [Ignavibacteriae bacterium]|nr:isocitrate lyase/phosphoenolpyruvate mutase family protein [Ignavibacteriota bacterium]
MISQYEIFTQLHKSDKPLLLGNVWNVQSAKVYEKLKFSAIGTSSAAIANSLGYDDGENISFEEYFNLVKKISKNTNIPLSVDLEAGFGNDIDTIFSNIKRLSEIGIAGINIEDSIVKNSKRSILSSEIFTEKLNQLCKKLNAEKINIFVNVRTDTYLLNLENKLIETKKRIHMYESANIHGIFIPCIINICEIEELVNLTKLPINVMCMPNLPDFKTLNDIGVKRISMGNFINDFVYTQMESKMNEIIFDQNFKSLF